MSFESAHKESGTGSPVALHRGIPKNSQAADGRLVEPRACNADGVT